MNYLVFRLYGPMAGWGEAAVGGDRPSALHPSRSAILGLVASALGIRRDDVAPLDELRLALGVGIKSYSGGELTRDYHTAQVPSHDRKRRFFTRRDELDAPKHKLNTVLSSRDYRSNGYWVVALWLRGDSGHDLAILAEALKKPAFPLYLGRKSCPPAAPLMPTLVEGTLKEALDASFPPLLDDADQDRHWLSMDGYCHYYWQGSADELGGYDGIQSRNVWDEPISRVPWQFGTRQEHQLTLPVGEE
ncbi:type I-E CRISPR-associated protein Cas5/CasD [Marinobacterium litorale]|uniref:type I-E CRISPR-associated protein Cas5/CasD n=1 Tax=Marinobacterium litorale TaxID=404770 RepID=UPI000423B2FF|nr:type I-E CRISPR-associated protein Cas5/CasD [Marinobacterium litorale]